MTSLCNRQTLAGFCRTCKWSNIYFLQLFSNFTTLCTVELQKIIKYGQNIEEKNFSPQVALKPQFWIPGSITSENEQAIDFFLYFFLNLKIQNAFSCKAHRVVLRIKICNLCRKKLQLNVLFSLAFV